MPSTRLPPSSSKEIAFGNLTLRSYQNTRLAVDPRKAMGCVCGYALLNPNEEAADERCALDWSSDRGDTSATVAAERRVTGQQGEQSHATKSVRIAWRLRAALRDELRESLVM